MPRDLPERPDLGELRRQAEEHLGAVSENSTLADAQLALAREYGFASWRRLTLEVERKTALADGDVEALARLVAAFPSLAAERVSSRFSGDATSALSHAAVAGFHGLVDHRRAGDIARVLLEAGAPVDGDPDDFETPLITAASYYETGMVRILIEAGADLEATGREIPGGTALTHAVWFGQARIVDLLVDAGALVRSIVEAAGPGNSVVS
jgi:hypothetical protein